MRGVEPGLRIRNYLGPIQGQEGSDVSDKLLLLAPKRSRRDLEQPQDRTDGICTHRQRP
jgi:hypothetical protein